MIKKIIFSLIILLFSPFVTAEELINNRHYFNHYENPIYYTYMDDYINLIGEKFGKIRYYRNNIFVIFNYTLQKDGTISEFEVDRLTNSPMNVPKLKKIVETTILPFYKGMDKNSINISIKFATNNYCDSYKIDYYINSTGSEVEFSIWLDRKIK